jgi:hypothetical protein
LVPTVDGVVSNWGGFPGDFEVDGKKVSYATLMRKYFEIQKILLNGIKLKETKKTNNNCFYTDNIKIWDTNPSAYTVCDISKFGVNGRKLYYIKNFSTAQTQDAKIGDICYYDNMYQVYYGNGE